ncbi:hypothetical protein FA10DRAFT_268452 [Acaromyces ingoldii]|uniref:Nucleoporin Pom152 n=1 Tax=Acaromyces ingoldii TaxID=215250 RepID=A0A316YFQ2_9BASI|nr:hypothetical protein FA10DRAFT_268452 [Acaromyces ingoldii]PWN88247.1 hypothetical protein FA10DRAFT_268452 [Acaromyces ingoldii]
MSAPATPKQGEKRPSQPSLPATAGPLISLSFIDAPTQRVYAASIFVALQTYKVVQLLSFIFSPSLFSLLGTFVLIDLAFVAVVSRLRIPRLDLSRAKWTIVFGLLASTDWIVLGGWRVLLSSLTYVPLLGWLGGALLGSWSDAFNRQVAISEHRVSIRDLIRPTSHIFGQHTIHILPYSTATLSPAYLSVQSADGGASDGKGKLASSSSSSSSSSSTRSSPLSSCFCLDPSNPKAELSIPLVFNNTEPQFVSYSVTPFDGSAPLVFNVTIPRGALTRLGEANKEWQRARGEDELDLELDDLDDYQQASSGGGAGNRGSELVRRDKHHQQQQQQQQQQHQQQPHAKAGATNEATLFHLPIKNVGRVRLERVLDKNRFDARLSKSEIMIVECPSAAFIDGTRAASAPKGRKTDMCPGDEASLDVRVRGLAPLRLHYTRQSSLRRGKEPLSISHISSHHHASPLVAPEGSSIDAAQHLSVALRGAPSKVDQSFSWAQARDVDLPLTLQLSGPGIYEYELESVSDACGNSFDAVAAASSPRTKLTPQSRSRTVEVHPRPSVQLRGCTSADPIKLLKGKGAKEVEVQLNVNDADGGPWSAQVRFDGEDAASSWRKNVTINSSDSRAKLPIERPGTYTLEGVNGRYCAGDVGAPWICSAVEVQPPTAMIEFDSIQDHCAGPVGVKALAVLSGTPPFRLAYTVQTKGRAPVAQERYIERTRDEIEFRPSQEGEVTYTFTGLSDANYRERIALDGPKFTQSLHPIAKARFAGSSSTDGSGSLVVQSCEGDRAQAQVLLEGTGPFELVYSVRDSSIASSGKSKDKTRKSMEQHRVKDIQTDRYLLDVELPSALAREGGRATISLVSIKDAKGCERALTTDDLNIDVRRTRPTVGFAAGGQLATSSILEGGSVDVPIRLTGEAPWKVKYTGPEEGSKAQEVTVQRPEGILRFSQAGSYRIVGVTDRHCPGEIATDKAAHTVSVRPRPSARFLLESIPGLSNESATLVRPPVCVGVPDAVEVGLAGQFPVRLTYSHQPPNGKSKQSDTFSSAQDVATIQLDTSRWGEHTYELEDIGDAIYRESARLKGGRMLKQQVHPLPQASFSKESQRGAAHGQALIKKGSGSSANGKGQDRPTFCVGDTLSQNGKGDGTNQDRRSSSKGGETSSTLPKLSLSGTPPFEVEVAIYDDASSITAPRFKIHKAGLSASEVELGSLMDLDAFTFDRTGRWNAEVVRVKDGNGCEFSYVDQAGSTAAPGKQEEEDDGIVARAGGAVGRGQQPSQGGGLEIDVVETASIVSVGTRTDYCIGESVDYILQGRPPWRVNYRFDGRQSQAVVRDVGGLFSRVAEQAGVLDIEEVAPFQQANYRCGVRFEEGEERRRRLQKVVHPLPTVKVHGGMHFVEDLREGSQAEIVFTLQGTPPFAFTYQRTQPADTVRRPRVLETHTVTGIETDRYSLWTSKEGTWSVTWLQDRWCSVSLDDVGNMKGQGVGSNDDGSGGRQRRRLTR